MCAIDYNHSLWISYPLRPILVNANIHIHAGTVNIYLIMRERNKSLVSHLYQGLCLFGSVYQSHVVVEW